MASSKKDLKRFPEEVQDVMGRALLDVQFGDTPENSKPLRSFGGAGVAEIMDDFQGDTYRVVYTVAFPGGFTSSTRSRRSRNAVPEHRSLRST